MRRVFQAQRDAFAAEGSPDSAIRIDRINRALDLLLDSRDELIDALRADYGHRSGELSLLTDIVAAAEALKYARRRLRRWMRPRRRAVNFPLGFFLPRRGCIIGPKESSG